eukprot:COSAG01_NODE_614_length_14830_cov_87.820572_4_plen_92_part_00
MEASCIVPPLRSSGKPLLQHIPVAVELRCLEVNDICLERYDIRAMATRENKSVRAVSLPKKSLQPMAVYSISRSHSICQEGSQLICAKFVH